MQKLIERFKKASRTNDEGAAALSLHASLESANATFVVNEMSTKRDLVEDRLKGWRYRVNILKQITAAPFIYSFGPLGSRKNSTISFNLPMTMINKKDLIDIMTDSDITAWLNAVGQAARSRKRKRGDLGVTFDKDKFVRKRRGVWETAVSNFMKETPHKNQHLLSTLSSFAPPSPILPCNKDLNVGSPTQYNDIVPTCEADVATPAASSYLESGDEQEQSIAEPCYICFGRNRETVGNVTVVCGARLCRRSICDVCLIKQEGLETNLATFSFYCDDCYPQTAEWRASKFI